MALKAQQIRKIEGYFKKLYKSLPLHRKIKIISPENKEYCVWGMWFKIRIDSEYSDQHPIFKGNNSQEKIFNYDPNFDPYMGTSGPQELEKALLRAYNNLGFEEFEVNGINSSDLEASEEYLNNLIKKK